MNLLQEVEEIAREAGAATMTVYAQNFDVQEKEDKSPLTEADAAAYSIIAASLANLHPLRPILSEEAIEDFSGLADSESYWLVDPLDGKKEFIKRNGEFTVNIALIKMATQFWVWYLHLHWMWLTWQRRVWEPSRYWRMELARQFGFPHFQKLRLGESLEVDLTQGILLP